ncbi:hypothetical protein AAVH_39109 [Aphelenchoides avenae]|nr:hypothetical protein AAVH_39109 [Aphelenchus avenae]
MGRGKAQTKNQKKFGLKIGKNKIQKANKKKPANAMEVDEATVDEMLQQASVESVPSTDSQEPVQKPAPKRKEDYLRRHELPLLVTTKKVEKVLKKETTGKETPVTSVRQMSKKKARKVLNAKRREERKRERLENAMEQ